MAKYKIIPSSRTIMQSPISIGHKAEKGVEAIEFDLTAWVETYGSGTLTVIMRRWGDAIPYPIALEIDENNKATWTLSDADTAKAGMAYAQLSYIVGDEVVKKSDIYTFRVMDSLTGEGEPPEAYESWLEHLTHFAAEAMAEVLDIEGIVTDKTLTVDGGIADGKATGDALALKADKSTTYTKTEVDRMIEDVEVETDTTLSVSGAPADAKKTGDELSALKADLIESIDVVNSVTEKLNANLLSAGAYVETIGGVEFSYNAGQITRNGTSDAVVHDAPIGDVIALPAGTYTFFVEGQTSQAFALKDAITDQLIVDASTRTFTITTKKYLQLVVSVQTAGATYSDTKKLQLNEGETSLDWVASNISANDSIAREDIAEIGLVINGGSKVFTPFRVPHMIGSDGTQKSESSTINFYQINGLDGLASVDSITFSFQSSGAAVTHWFNQFDNEDNLLSYVPFREPSGSNPTVTVSLVDNCSYIKVSVWVANGDWIASHVFTPKFLTRENASPFTKLSALGDSITVGYSPGETVTNTYQKLIADQLGASFQRLGYSSTPICPNSNYTGDNNDHAFVYRYNEIDSDADLIIVAGGTNDFRHDVPLGNPTDDATAYESTFYGAVDYLINNIVANHLTARLVFITPFHQKNDTVANGEGHKLIDYVDAIKTKCGQYGIACIDGYSQSGINLISAFTTECMTDSLHPNDEGHRIIYKNLMPYFAML